MKIIPIFFYHEKWAVIMRKFVYSPDGVEKMGPLRGDGNFYIDICIEHSTLYRRWVPFVGTETSNLFYLVDNICREDGSPSWGRKHVICNAD